MALDDLARDYYIAQAALVDAVVEAARAVWFALDPLRLSASWSRQRAGERLFVGVATGQLEAARAATPFVTKALLEQDVVSAPVALQPRMLAGVASDGRDLEELMLRPLIETLEALDAGVGPEVAMRSGAGQLANITATQVADAGREGVHTAMVAQPAVTGWVRMLVPPSCGRCAILAGRRYRWSEGFERHPQCDCRHVPAAEDRADDLRTDPAAYFASLNEADQNRYFGKGRAEAIRLGADMYRTVNARSVKAGMSTAGRGRRRSGRLMPADLIKQGAGDRARTLQLLRRYGYLR